MSVSFPDDDEEQTARQIVTTIEKILRPGETRVRLIERTAKESAITSSRPDIARSAAGFLERCGPQAQFSGIGDGQTYLGIDN
jgi:hypothetical protein